MKYKNVLQFADYASPYKGNFISSLEILEKKIGSEHHKMYYLFTNRTSKREWAKQKKNAFFLKGKFLYDIKFLKEIIKKYEIDIIHIHFFSFKILLLIKLSNIKCKKIIHLHGMMPNYKNFKKNILKVMFKNFEIIGCSEAVIDNFKFSESVKKITCIKNAIYFPRLDEYEIIKEVNNNDNTEKILIFGYNYYVKGVDIALEAIGKAKEQIHNIECYVSLSSNKDTFEKKVIEKFGKIPKWINILKPRNDIASYYKFCDVFISASREEGFCYAIVEAAYLGCNIIASKIPAQEELEIENIFWFESENSEDLKNKILDCIKNKELNKKKMIQQNESIVKKYDIYKWAKEVEKQYNS